MGTQRLWRLLISKCEWLNAQCKNDWHNPGDITAVMMTSSNGNIFRVTGYFCGEYRSPVNSPHKDQWRGALMFSSIYVWINDWVNYREAGDLRSYRTHYDVMVMVLQFKCDITVNIHIYKINYMPKYCQIHSLMYGMMLLTWCEGTPDNKKDCVKLNITKIWHKLVSCEAWKPHGFVYQQGELRHWLYNRYNGYNVDIISVRQYYALGMQYLIHTHEWSILVLIFRCIIQALLLANCQAMPYSR